MYDTKLQKRVSSSRAKARKAFAKSRDSALLDASRMWKHHLLLLHRSEQKRLLNIKLRDIAFNAAFHMWKQNNIARKSFDLQLSSSIKTRNKLNRLISTRANKLSRKLKLRSISHKRHILAIKYLRHLFL